jgi:NAD-dependent dihydropyrimidine dehydrogenase PreA subunit
MCPILAKPHGQDGSLGEYWREPLDAAKHKSPRGTINLIKDRCKSCEFCIEFCPQGILEISDDFNAKGYHLPKVVDEANCIACRLCELICPEFAIHITEDEIVTTTNESSHEHH